MYHGASTGKLTAVAKPNIPLFSDIPEGDSITTFTSQHHNINIFSWILGIMVNLKNADTNVAVYTNNELLVSKHWLK